MSNYWRTIVTIYALIGAVFVLAGELPYVPEPLASCVLLLSFSCGLWSVRELWRKESA